MSLKSILLLCVDSGTTDSKIIYKLGENQFVSPSLLLIPSATTGISKEEVDAYESSRLTEPLPETEAWVKYDGQYYATGFLAKKFGAVLDKKALKYEDAITKVLATVGIIACKENLTQPIELNLTVPLPYSEWRDRNKIKEELATALSKFSFRGREFSVDLKYFGCFPESGGLMLNRSKKLKGKFKESKITSIMLGYRDISIVVSERANPSGSTKKLGFVNMIESVQELTSGLEAEELLKSLNKAGQTMSANNFYALAKSNRKERKVQEVSEIVEAVKSARVQYWQKIVRWLTASLPSDTDEIIIGGGVAHYLETDLKDLFSAEYPEIPVYWSGELEEDVKAVFSLEEEQKSLAFRLADAYGLFLFMEQTRARAKPIAANTSKGEKKEVSLVPAS